MPPEAFPRAEFGLPIVFHFQNNEVPDTVLYPQVGNEHPERMASPLILKPLCLANGKAVSLAVRLDVPGFSGVELTQQGRNNVVGTYPHTAVCRSDLATYTNSPLAGSSGSALEAFLKFLASKGFTRC
jgi:CRISPR-associated protein Cmr1